jgi:hypothetical protein
MKSLHQQQQHCATAWHLLSPHRQAGVQPGSGWLSAGRCLHQPGSGWLSAGRCLLGALWVLRQQQGVGKGYQQQGGGGGQGWGRGQCQQRGATGDTSLAPGPKHAAECCTHGSWPRQHQTHSTWRRQRHAAAAAAVQRGAVPLTCSSCCALGRPWLLRSALARWKMKSAHCWRCTVWLPDLSTAAQGGRGSACALSLGSLADAPASNQAPYRHQHPHPRRF